MQRNSQALLGLLFLVGVAVVLILTRQSRGKAHAPVASASASVSAAPRSSVAAPIGSGSLESAVETALSPEEGANEGFDILPDGKKAPPLPDTAPQSVTFGVVQFAYDGAQFANKGARTKEQAREKARSFMELAQKDFEAAVAKGDRGSRSNVGRMHRGILEPAVEYLLFTLPKATVYGEPVDTPRGYWIIRRID
jgi:hypothetical protein